MAFYPIAYAVRETTQDANFFDGFKVKGEAGEPDFKIVQAAKTNLHLSTVIEGEYKLKVIQPWMGFGTRLRHDGAGMGTSTGLDFSQRYPYHAQSKVATDSASFSYWRRQMGANHTEDDGTVSSWEATHYVNGKPYSWAVGEDLAPYNENYLDKMYNDVRPSVAGGKP